MPSVEIDPLVSVVIVTWNSSAYLARCLDSLAAQSFKDFEVVLVDNGSTDGSIVSLETRWPQLAFQIERLGENKGFAAANNVGANLARGKWLALLNSDAFPESDWLERVIQAAKQHPEFSFFACRQLQANRPDLLDGAGDTYHVSGLAWRSLEGQPVCQAGSETREVFSACAAAAVYSRQAFKQVGGFDEDFFSYHEDVDLSFRMRLLGFRCLYVPEATVKHIGSASAGRASSFAIYHGHRNLIWTYMKNMPAGLFWLYLPYHLSMNLFALLYFSTKGQARAIWKAKWDGLRGMGLMLQKRKEIQSRRSASVASLRLLMDRDWLAPLLKKKAVR